MLAIITTLAISLFAGGTAATTPDAAKSNALAAEAWQLWQKHELSSALDKFQEAVKLDPNNANAWNGLGWVYFNSGSFEKAKEAWEKCLKIEPKHPAALNGLGQLALTRRQYDEAEKQLLAAAENPNATAAFFGLARLYLLQGKWEQAQKWAEKLTASADNGADAQQMLAAAKARRLDPSLRSRLEPPPAAKTSRPTPAITGETPAGPRAAIATALEDFRKALVTYGLGFNAVFPQKLPAMYDPERLEQYPGPGAWPEVLGSLERAPKLYRLLEGSEDFITPQDETSGVAFSSPLTGKVIASETSQPGILCLEGIDPKGVITQNGYTSLVCKGDMAGKVLFTSYASMLIDGNLTGKVQATSYFCGVIRGKMTGSLTLDSYAMVYLLGGLGGKVQLSHSTIVIAGFLSREQLQRISGTGRVFVEDADLPAGTHKIDGLAVTVGRRINRTATQPAPATQNK